AERYREKEVIKRRLAALSSESHHILEYIHQTLRLFNGTKGNSQSFDLLDALLRDQAYRLAFWQVAAEEINYRRFFDVNQLAAIRMENPQVFEAVHQLVFDLLRKGFVTGLRIDHVDGLHTPRDYLTQWQQWAQHELGIPPDAKGRSLFLVVEKILGRGESLCEDWPVHGTTGYDFLMLLNTLFVDPSHKREMDAIYTRFTKLATSFEQIVYESKKLIMASSMSSELNALGHQVNLLSEKNRWSRDFTLNSLTHAIREIIACFPVYRTYVSAHPDEVIPDRDRAYIRLAVMRAKRLNPATNSQVFDFIQHLLLKLPGEHPRLLWKDVAPFVMKFQQTTSPVTAKGVEDTAFYRYNRLISLNEVGGDPTQFGMSLQMFHERMRERQLHWPLTFSATSTHDTKRGEDVRARINVLSELPKEWKSCVSRWHRMNKKHKTMLDDQPVPDRNEEYFLYQTLIGAWPFEPLDPQSYTTFCERMHAYFHKALKEAKLHTSWVNPQEAYEQAVHRFLERILARPNPFLDDFLSFQEKIAQYGIYNALSQVVLKITAPGIPDFYQGTELWDLNLVDPDNRHPVDYTLRQTLLESLAPWESPKGPEFWKMLLESRRDGRIKLFITTRLLQFRKQQARLFHEGEYLPLETTGKNGHYLVAFQRRQAQQNALVIAPRFLTRVIPDPTILPVGETVWGDTRIELPQELQGVTFREVITDRLIEPLSNNQTPALSVARLFDHLPVAVLECRV
ncbi:MAG: malto-oligosyltrehalose synthase, partial [Nitrospirae bacterium]